MLTEDGQWTGIIVQENVSSNSKNVKRHVFLDFDKTYIRTLEHWLTHHFKNVKRHVKYVAKLKFGTLGRIIS